VNIFRMAWRNVWRNRRRSLVTISAMSFALFSMLLYTGIIEWYLQDMERAVVDLEVGDVQIFPKGYRDDPSIYTRIEEPEALLEPLAEAGFRAAPRLLAFGLAATGESSSGVSFRGVDVERDARVSLIYRELGEGSWLDPGDPRGVVIGRRLARTLDATLGVELLVLSQAADGSMAYDLYTVRGILKSVADATDRTGFFMTADAFRQLFVVESGAHQILVRKPDEVELAAAVRRVRALGAAHDVKTWRELMPTVASMVDSARGMMVFVSLIIYFAVGILILNAMLMAVFERVREFGVLKAVGVGPTDVLRLILVETAIQTGIAIAVGLGFALPSLIYFRDVGVDIATMADVSVMGLTLSNVWHAAIAPQVIATPILTLIFIVVAAVLYPAFKAALIQPVEAMRYH
jgi:ABC-type lipoprotein release transport system permease subunit